MRNSFSAVEVFNSIQKMTRVQRNLITNQMKLLTRYLVPKSLGTPRVCVNHQSASIGA